VETEQELAIRLGCGARYVQGYLFARPAENFFATDAVKQSFRVCVMSMPLGNGRTRQADWTSQVPTMLFSELRKVARQGRPNLPNLPHPKATPGYYAAFSAMHMATPDITELRNEPNNSCKPTRVSGP